jgi:DNA-binding NarL/FixJ family response regulator
MYTIVIADDEAELRQALIRRIDWKEVGFEVVGEAENGAGALSGRSIRICTMPSLSQVSGTTGEATVLPRTM